MAVTRTDGNDKDAKMAGADLRDKLLFLAALDADGNLVLAGAGSSVYGVIVEDGDIGQPITVDYRGLTKAIAGGAIDEGAPVGSNNLGKAVSGVTPTFGVARNSVAAEDEIVEILTDRGAA